MKWMRWAVTALALAAAPAAAQSADPADALQGVWASETNYPATLRGELVVTREGEHWCAFVRPRDLLKLGQAYLDGGVWNRRRIVNADWVRESTTARIEVSPETTGMTQEQFENFYALAQDGYAWHLGETHAGEHAYPTYMASGNGGQLLIVIPACDLAVVFTGGNYMQGGIWLRWRDDIVGGAIIPAMSAGACQPSPLALPATDAPHG